MSDIHWKLREHLHHFKRDGRLATFIYLYLRKNIRNRCWPSYITIMPDIGSSKPTVSKAIQWLEETLAIIRVPYEKRIGDEKKLPVRSSVYQLTGIIVLDGEIVPYMAVTPETQASIIEELRSLNRQDVIELIVKGKETLPLKVKSVKGKETLPKDITNKTQKIKPTKKQAKRTPQKRERKKKPTELEAWLLRLHPIEDIVSKMLLVCESSFDPLFQKPHEVMTIPMLEKYVPMAEELVRVGCKLEDVQPLYDYINRENDKRTWNIAPKTLVRLYPSYKAHVAELEKARQVEERLSTVNGESPNGRQVSAGEQIQLPKKPF